VAASVIVEEETFLEESPLVGGKEFGSVWVVVQHPERSTSDDNSGDTFKAGPSAWSLVKVGKGSHENPPPPLVSSNTIHKVDQPSEQTTEGSSGSSSREEESDSEVDFVSSVPLSEEERDTREKTSFGDTEEDTGDQEGGVAGNETHADHDYSPGQHNGRKPHRWSPSLLVSEIPKNM
jgi:hypothetical protein